MKKLSLVHHEKTVAMSHEGDMRPAQKSDYTISTEKKGTIFNPWAANMVCSKEDSKPGALAKF